MDLRCARVGQGQPVVDFRAGLKPHTMSWSNLVDYMRPTEFHDLARRCSAESDVIHYGYSMNWVFETVGTCILDTENSDIRQSIIQNTRRVISRFARVPPTTAFFPATTHCRSWINHTLTRHGAPVQVGRVAMLSYNQLGKNNWSVYFSWTYSALTQLKQSGVNSA